jgi:hypothetical protein
MLENTDYVLPEREETHQPAADAQLVTASQESAVPEPAVAEQEVPQSNGVPAVEDPAPRWHAEAGRKGARRIHQLIQEGVLYEKEHGLKRGRQRLRQLIEQGKLYEREHGLGVNGKPPRAEGRRRVSSDQLFTTLLQTLLRIAKPAYRPKVARLLQALEQETT